VKPKPTSIPERVDFSNALTCVHETGLTKHPLLFMNETVLSKAVHMSMYNLSVANPLTVRDRLGLA
jgi:hypothetical protein